MSTNLTPRDVAEAYTILGVLPYAQALSGDLLAALCSLYTREGIAPRELREAALWAATTLRAWPPPSVLLERIREQRHRSVGQPAETAEEAWGSVRSVMQSGWHGDGLPPQLSDRARAAFAAACNPSWATFWGAAQTSDMVAHRARFIDAYKSSRALDGQLLEHERRKREKALPWLNSVVGSPRRLPYDGSEEDYDLNEPGPNYTGGEDADCG